MKTLASITTKLWEADGVRMWFSYLCAPKAESYYLMGVPTGASSIKVAANLPSGMICIGDAGKEVRKMLREGDYETALSLASTQSYSAYVSSRERVCHSCDNRTYTAMRCPTCWLPRCPSCYGVADLCASCEVLTLVARDYCKLPLYPYSVSITSMGNSKVHMRNYYAVMGHGYAKEWQYEVDVFVSKGGTPISWKPVGSNSRCPQPPELLTRGEALYCASIRSTYGKMPLLAYRNFPDYISMYWDLADLAKSLCRREERGI